MTQTVRRKLAAVLHADVKGYSRLMSRNEVETVRTLKAHREIMFGLVRDHRGRVVDTAGDGFLLEFASVVDALECAVALQRTLKERNDELPADGRLQFRIGINIGDVIEEDEKIFGDGVNIAARLEGLAEPGGICISGTAYDQVRNKLDFGYEYLGEQLVKNIPELVRVYKVLLDPGQVSARTLRAVTAGQKKLTAIAVVAIICAFTIGVAFWYAYWPSTSPPRDVPSYHPAGTVSSEQPSIAVMPFVNMSGDSTQEYFADGITEELITRMAQIPRLLVVASNSSFALKGKSVNIRDVGRDLGVRYVVEGSVRKADPQVRVTAQLIDAKTGHHLWAERYERDMEGILALQDDIAEKIVESLRIKLAPGEQPVSRPAAPPRNQEAFDKLLRAKQLARLETEEANQKARQLLKDAVSLDPASAQAYAFLARTHLVDIAHGWTKSRRDSLQEAEELTNRALATNDSLDFAHVVASRVHLMKRQHDRAITEAERAVALNPNNADAHASCGVALVFAGKPEEAIEFVNKAIRLNPIAPGWYFQTLGNACTNMKRYDEAITAYGKALFMQKNDVAALTGLTWAYALAGREEEARSSASKLLELNPAFSVKAAEKRMPYKNPSDLAPLIQALGKAGLK